MVLDPQFLDWMFSTITVENCTGLSTDGYASRAYAAPFTWKARIEQIGKLVKSKEGREIQSDATIFGPPYDTNGNTISVGPNDRITLPAGYLISGSSQPAIIDTSWHDDDTGRMYIQLDL